MTPRYPARPVFSGTDPWDTEKRIAVELATTLIGARLAPDHLVEVLARALAAYRQSLLDAARESHEFNVPKTPAARACDQMICRVLGTLTPGES